jgi:hypothetical protein
VERNFLSKLDDNFKADAESRTTQTNKARDLLSSPVLLTQETNFPTRVTGVEINKSDRGLFVILKTVYFNSCIGIEDTVVKEMPIENANRFSFKRISNSDRLRPRNV